MHGTADRVLPTAHAQAFAVGLRYSSLHLVEGMGHLPTRREWRDLADLVSRFLSDTAAYRPRHDLGAQGLGSEAEATQKPE